MLTYAVVHVAHVTISSRIPPPGYAPTPYGQPPPPFPPLPHLPPPAILPPGTDYPPHIPPHYDPSYRSSRSYSSYRSSEYLSTAYPSTCPSRPTLIDLCFLSSTDPSYGYKFEP